MDLIDNKKDLTPEEKEEMIKEIRPQIYLKKDGDRKENLNIIVKSYLESNAPECLGNIDKIIQEVEDRLFSLGPLEKYLRDDQVTDIHVYGTKITVEKSGKIIDDQEGFLNLEEVNRVIQRITSQAGKEISEAHPSVDAEVYEGSRAIVIIPPEAEQPYITIRKHNMQRMNATLELLSKTLKGLDQEVIDYLKNAVKNRKNIVVCGETGAGKTTLVDALAKEIQPLHKVAILEDTREIFLDHLYVMYLKTRDGNDDINPITYTDILHDCLRSRPARIILMEVRTAHAAYELIQTLNTGHAGSMTTIHANSAIDGLHRLEILIKEHSDIDITTVRQMLIRVIDIVISINLIEDDTGNVVGREVKEIIELDKELSGETFILKCVRGDEPC